MTHTPVQGQKIWIIGASSGIGAETARELNRRGAQVAISARRAERLSDIAQGEMACIPLDVTDTDAVSEAYTAVREEIGPPDIVLYSAGSWKQTPKGSFSAQDFSQHLAVNLQGLANVLDVIVPSFVERGTGTIAAIASVAGYRGVPGGEYYGATKAAQINLLEALRGSLQPKGVDVVTICPGFVETDMTATNDFPMPFAISPKRAAHEIADGLEAGKQEIIFPKRMAVAMKTARLVPVRAWTKLVAR